MNGRSEWQAYRKMKCKIATEFGMDYGVMVVALFHHWIDGFHTHIEAQDEIIEIEPKTQAV